MSLRTEGPVALALRRVKVALHGVRRRARWYVEAWPAPALAERPAVLGFRRAVGLAGLADDARLEAGKRHNLRLAAVAFDGVEVTPARPLSFWRTLGPATAARGFRPGLEVRGGCVVPSVGGGLCALSNALFAMAAELGWDVLERHGHSVALADPRALDATVAWPHVDLRIAPRHGRAVLAVRVERDALVVEAWLDRAPAATVELAIEDARDRGDLRLLRVRRRVIDGDRVDDRVLVDDAKRIVAPVPGVALRTCLTCGETACPTGRRERARLGRLPVVP